ncbi:MAG: serine O-acetyltransferase [Deltaproteobacteria bacterium]|nr:serine O-acetyltransferase [Deltaproteobacteria bacterium]
MREDVVAVLTNDPAARSAIEVVLTTPGLHAIWLHRLAHGLWRRDRKLVARVLSHLCRFATGVEIHPGARVGRKVFIDHGMGVVVGETATIGDGCLIFKGVVLGGTSMERKIRHPQLGKNVVVGSNACILGHIEIGDGARIGSGSVVIRDVPADATVVGIPGRVVPPRDGPRAHVEGTLDHANLPDPVAETIRELALQNENLRLRMARLEDALNIHAPEAVEDGPEPSPV